MAMTVTTHLAPDDLIVALRDQLTHEGVQVQLVDRDTATIAAAHLMSALGVDIDLDAWPPLLDDGAAAEQVLRDRAERRGEQPSSYSPAGLIGHAHHILDAASALPAWPYQTGRHAEADRASPRLRSEERRVGK